MYIWILKQIFILQNKICRVYDQYSFQIIPVLGTLIAGEWQPYQYLVESIRKFPKQEDFKVNNKI